MQYLAAERMGNVLKPFPDVCCCEVLRTALYRELSDKSLLECVQGKCCEWVLTVRIVNCLWCCGVWKLVAVVCCSDGAAASCNVVDTQVLNPDGNTETWKQLVLFFCVSVLCCIYMLWCFRGTYCFHHQDGWVWFVCGMCRCSAEIGVVVNLTTLSSPPCCWP